MDRYKIAAVELHTYSQDMLPIVNKTLVSNTVIYLNVKSVGKIDCNQNK